MTGPLTALQIAVIAVRVAEGFQVVGQDDDGVVRLTKGADSRVVLKDGSEKRGGHYIARIYKRR